jgi:hypothetical protein
MAKAVNKRIEERRLFTVTFDFTYSTIAEERQSCKNGFGISTNISNSGMGFLTNEPFENGQDIKVFNPRISDGPRAAQIRWCVKLSESLYKVGVCFN